MIGTELLANRKSMIGDVMSITFPDCGRSGLPQSGWLRQ
jgi:hypothetical protein